MFCEIVNKYENFSDALISEIFYHVVDNSRSVEIVLNCMNAFKDYEYETIKLTFIDPISICFKENENQSSTVVNSAFLAMDNGIIVFDFFPLIFGERNLKENENSDLKIKCKGISYEVVSNGSLPIIT